MAGGVWKGFSDLEDCWIPQPSSFMIFSPKLTNGDLSLVSKLIKDNAYLWNIHLLRFLFSISEVNLIRSLPLSFQNQGIAWFGILIGITSSWSNAIIIWPLLGLVTNMPLRVEDTCLLCGALGESTIHLMRDCPFAACVWIASPLRPPPKGHNIETMDDWALLLASLLKQADFDLCLMIWDALGLFVATRVARFKNVFSPAHVEALAARESLAMIVERGFSNSILECDSLQITIALRGSSSNTSFIRPVIEDVKALMSRITGVTTAHVHRQANDFGRPFCRSLIG
ncbi:hypothetical protein FF1_046471 [Malus domestica]